MLFMRGWALIMTSVNDCIKIVFNYKYIITYSKNWGSTAVIMHNLLLALLHYRVMQPLLPISGSHLQPDKPQECDQLCEKL